MIGNHEPDPRFIDSLEGQLGRALRHEQRAGSGRVRVLRTGGLMLVCVALGAAGMGASQQLGDGWRRDLLETRLNVELKMARQRVQTQLEALNMTRQQVRQGVRSDRELAFVEFQIAQAEGEARIKDLELEEVQQSGREPLDVLGAPLVDGRDFVSERIRIRMNVASQHLELVQASEGRSARRVDAGVVDSSDLGAEQLVAREAELQLQALAQQLEIRRAYLDSDISAVVAELRQLEQEAQNRLILLQERRAYLQRELGHLQSAIEAGAIRPIAAAQMQSQVDDVELQLSLADAERQIVRAELERRRSPR